jgi:hypothetical protein
MPRSTRHDGILLSAYPVGGFGSPPPNCSPRRAPQRAVALARSSGYNCQRPVSAVPTTTAARGHHGHCHGPNQGASRARASRRRYRGGSHRGSHPSPSSSPSPHPNIHRGTSDTSVPGWAPPHIRGSILLASCRVPVKQLGGQWICPARSEAHIDWRGHEHPPG